MKKVITAIIIMFIICGCTVNFKSGLKFKKLIEQENSSYRKVTIKEDNPFEIIDIDSLINKFKKEESFYLLVGSNKDNQTRSTLETFIEVAKEEKLNKIYYIDITDYRDELALENEEVIVINNGDIRYQYLLDYLKDKTVPYILHDKFGNPGLGNEGRIYDGTYFHVVNGKAISTTTGTSVLQDNYTDDLTNEQIKDQKNVIREFILYKGE